MTTSIKAVVVDAEGSAPTVRSDLPARTPGPDEVLVRVQASSANPVDNAIAAGMLVGMIEHELITLPQNVGIAQRSGNVDLATAGAAPLVGITALTLVDALELSAGETVLVVGATGGVGSVAVQLAVAAGATVIAPALPEDEDFLCELGVGERLDRDGDVAGVGADAVLDLVSYAPGAFDAALKPGGRVASPKSAAGEGPGRTNVMSDPSTENLERLAQLLDGGTLEVHIQDGYELDRALEALQALGSTHTRGKLGIRVA